LSAEFGRFLQVLALASYWLEDCAIFYANAGGKLPIPILTTVSAMQAAASQSNFKNEQ
jgi:hypothetical protein